MTLQEILAILKEKKLDPTFDSAEPEDDLLPANFSMPSFPLYSGTTNPAIHVSNYESIMRMKGLTDRQMAKMFPVTLTGDAADWMNEQSGSLKVNWKELSKVFKERYAYTTKIQTTIQTLERMRQQPGESFRDYYTRWVAKELLLKDKLSLPKMITKLLDGALPIYRKHMALDNFADYNEVCQKRRRLKGRLRLIPPSLIYHLLSLNPRGNSIRKLLRHPLHYHLLQLKLRPQ